MEDPCATIAVELEAALAAKAAAEKEVVELRDVVRRLHEQAARLRGELDRRPVPEDTPFGAFLASPEADAINDPDLLAVFKALLDEFPVLLRPGEATWIAEQSVKDGQGRYDYPSQQQLIAFLGPERLATELPVDKLFEHLLWDRDYGPSIQAALPPRKRAEFRAKLHAIVKESDDPEEIEWILTTFPMFFD